MSEKDFTFELTTEADCPCGAKVQIGRASGAGVAPEVAMAGAGDSVPTILHPLPHCKEYAAKEFVDYLTYCRVFMQAQRGTLFKAP